MLLYEAGIIAWVVMLFGAILNGGLREKIIQPRIGEFALPLSALSGAVIFTGITYVMFKWSGLICTTQETFILGSIWLILTILFEIGFGRYFLKESWGKLLKAYDVRTGNLWSILLLYLFVLPFFVSKILL